jgi:hypothetical protein
MSNNNNKNKNTVNKVEKTKVVEETPVVDEVVEETPVVNEVVEETPVVNEVETDTTDVSTEEAPVVNEHESETVEEEVPVAKEDTKMVKEPTKPVVTKDPVDATVTTSHIINDGTTSEKLGRHEEVKAKYEKPGIISHPLSEAIQLKVGSIVTIKSTVTKTVTDTVIPAFAYKNVYRVEKILPNRIIIAAGLYKLALNPYDIVIK